MKAVVVFSGGLDSTTALYEACDRLGQENVEAVSFAYGQRHYRELQAGMIICKERLIKHSIVDLDGYPVHGIVPAQFMKGGALTGGERVPHGHYEDASMAMTVVPNRNMIFISICAARAMQLLAVKEPPKFVALYLGIHAGDHAIYPDCRGAFFAAMSQALAEVSGNRVILRAPFVGWKKEDIVKRGTNLGVPYALTWSCYEGGEFHCGKCGTCVERREAFEKAGVEDPTSYAP